MSPVLYDAIGNPLQYRDGMSFTWDKGRQLQSVTKNGVTTSYTYDENGLRLSKTTGGMTNSYAYSDDRLQTVTVNSSLQYAFAYDVFGRTTSTKVGNGTTWRTLSSLSYNSAGLMSKQTYGNGDYIDFTYDSLDRITEKKYNGSSTRRATYAYGADGSLARSTDFSTGTTTKYVYDLADRLVGVREYTGTSISARALRASTDYIYADKTNYLTGMRHFSPLGTQTVDYTYGDITEGQMPDQVYSVKWNGEEKLSYTYDPLGRLSTRTLHVTGNVESIPQLTTQYSYVNVGEDRTTTMVQSVTTNGVTHNYTYDAVGNIQSIQLGSDVTSYEYDSLNQLVRVNDPYLNRTITYEYENGNITFEHTYAYTTGDLPATPMYSTQYHYDDPVWRDVLTGSSYLRYNQNTANTASAYSADAAAEDDAAAALAESVLGEDFHAVELTENDLFGGTEAAGASAFGAQTASAQANSSAVVQSTSTIQSDEIGNIIDVDGMEFVWEGRQLQSIGANGTPYFSYEYNIDGQRTKKTVTDFDTGETTTTEYFYNSGMLMGQKTGNDVLVFMYDENGDIFGFTYNGTPYYYVKNAQNDVWAVTNADGQAVVLYFYDAWGNVTRSYEADGYEAIAEVNPILYRSYYCDLELGFYYLNTRYYVPAIHRYLNADGIVQTGQGMLDKNMFAYCANNPIRYYDPSGCYYVCIPAEGDGPAIITSATNATVTVGRTGNTYSISYTENVSIVTASQMSRAGFHLSQESLDSLNKVLRENNILTSVEISHFLAQCAAETNFGQWLTELGSDSYFAANGYGKKYRGAGYIQLTWDYNYQAFADYMGDPEIYNQGADYVAANYAWEAAGWFWTSNNINARIAAGATVKDVTRYVRGSYGTWERRQEYYNTFIGIF